MGMVSLRFACLRIDMSSLFSLKKVVHIELCKNLALLQQMQIWDSIMHAEGSLTRILVFVIANS